MSSHFRAVLASFKHVDGSTTVPDIYLTVCLQHYRFIRYCKDVSENPITFTLLVTALAGYASLFEQTAGPSSMDWVNEINFITLSPPSNSF